MSRMIHNGVLNYFIIFSFKRNMKTSQFSRQAEAGKAATPARCKGNQSSEERRRGIIKLRSTRVLYGRWGPDQGSS
uniref:Uncharacterized protein n=1 Tax=Nelumbo nucifera TaxID=4432 RepID=A0A822YEC7_NELNU|nr:TPA_asm: hypothetical protein HUJ06_009698 [Nelumbo nucifera]